MKRVLLVVVTLAAVASLFMITDTYAHFSDTANTEGNRITAGTWESVEAVVVEIDIMPSGSPNSINPNSGGVIPVAILTTTSFDATTADPGMVRFGPARAEAIRWASEDVDGDGTDDMILHFQMQQTGISVGDTEAELTGRTIYDELFLGSDSVRTVPPREG